MEKFTIRAALVTPAIINTLTLDGLLGAVLFEALQHIDRAHAAIPLRCSSGLFHASALRFVGPTVVARHGFIAGLRATHDLDLALLKQAKDGGPHRTLGLKRRSDFGNVMNSYTSTYANAVQWHAEGEPEAVLDLLRDVQFIGKKRTAGFGQVRGWELRHSTLDGLTDDQGQPLRPVPYNLWRGDPAAIRADAAWKPAYWLPQHRALCAVPAAPAP